MSAMLAMNSISFQQKEIGQHLNNYMYVLQKLNVKNNIDIKVMYTYHV
jgi:hypothetical protein